MFLAPLAENTLKLKKKLSAIHVIYTPNRTEPQRRQQMTAAVYVVIPCVLVFVGALSCLLVFTRLATTLQFACAELGICLDPLTRAKPAKVHLEPADVSELKIRMDRLECLMARVLNAVDNPLSQTSAAATQTHPQVQTEGYRHRQKSAQDLSKETHHATSIRAQSWESRVSQARTTQHNTSQRPPSRARSFETINSSFSLDSKAWNPQTSPQSTKLGSQISVQPVQVPAQVVTRIETNRSPKKFTGSTMK